MAGAQSGDVRRRGRRAGGDDVLSARSYPTRRSSRIWLGDLGVALVYCAVRQFRRSRRRRARQSASGLLAQNQVGHDGQAAPQGYRGSRPEHASAQGRSLRGDRWRDRCGRRRGGRGRCHRRRVRDYRRVGAGHSRVGRRSQRRCRRYARIVRRPPRSSSRRPKRRSRRSKGPVRTIRARRRWISLRRVPAGSDRLDFSASRTSTCWS